MRTIHLLRSAALSLVVAAPALSVAPVAIAAETYSFETDLWPALQAQLPSGAEQQTAQTRSVSVSDAGGAAAQSRSHGIYDRSDPFRDARTGVLCPGCPTDIGE